MAFWNFPAKLSQADKPYIDLELQKGTTPLAKQMAGLYTRNFRNNHHPKITEGDFNGPRAIISGDFKLVIDGEKETGVELFDLKNDFAESNNLAKAHPDVVRKLSKQLRAWQESVMNSLMERDYSR